MAKKKQRTCPSKKTPNAESSYFKPIHWLASYPKSGSTWARFLFKAYNQGVVDINQGANFVPGDMQPYTYHVVAPVSLADMTEMEILHLRYAALTHMNILHTKSLLLMKTHNANVNIYYIDLIPKMMSSNSVYLLRDPRDVAISYAKHMGCSIDDSIEMLGSMGTCVHVRNDCALRHYLTSWSNHVSSWIGDGTKKDILTVKYEDLLTDTKNQLRRILEHLGFRTIEGRLDQAVESAKFDNLRRQEEEEGFSEASQHAKRFFDKGRWGYWQEILTASQRKRIEKDHGDVMAQFGYL